MSTGSTEHGTLVVVGLGMQPGRHIGERALSEIRRADIVFAIAGELFLEWLRGMHSDVRDLRMHYAEDRDRRDTYRRMQDELVEATLEGGRIVAALYGHPGVFAEVGHAAIAETRTRGARAWMEPGVSAEACLYADLGLDPGDSGVQSFEATQFLVQRRELDAASLVLLWQVALAGNVDCTGFTPDPQRLEVLVDKLSRWYRRDTQVILYEAASLSLQDFRADRIRLDELPTATLSTATTLVIPPACSPPPDDETRTRLASIR